MPATAVKVRPITERREDPGLSLDQTLKDFIDSRKNGIGGKKQCSPISLHTYESNIRYFVDFMKKKGHTHWNDIMRGDVSDFSNWVRTKTGWRPSTISTRLRCVKVMFKWIEEDDECAEMRMRVYRKQLGAIAPTEHRDRIPSTAEIRQFLGGLQTHTRAGLRDYTMVMLFCDTGMRSGELRYLSLDEHVHLDQSMLLIPKEGKGKKVRTVWLQPETVTLLRKWLRKRETFAQCPYLFVTEQGTQCSSSCLTAVFDRVRERTGTKDVTPHMLRHYMCTTWLRNGGSVSKLQAMTGHRDLTSLQHYMHLVGDQSVAEEQRRVNTLRGLKPDHRTGRQRTEIN